MQFVAVINEYDAAQERGEVQRHGGDHTSKVSDTNLAPATLQELGLTKTEIHAARLYRDAEKEHPGIVRDTLQRMVDNMDEPSKTKLRDEIVTAAKRSFQIAVLS